VQVITFLDLAGHEKYLKTTVFGMTGCAPDYVMLIVSVRDGQMHGSNRDDGVKTLL
jgi:GTPase